MTIIKFVQPDHFYGKITPWILYILGGVTIFHGRLHAGRCSWKTQDVTVR